MKIKTGKSVDIALITLVGIFSISALNALPGLAVSPILGDLNTIFPTASDLEIQMLTSLPSLLIIPFILLSGKLTEKLHPLFLLRIGLSIFALSGILYLLSTKMWELVVVSALLGIGSGIIVPLSTGLISRFFIGKYRTKQFGYSSAITNLTLVVATVLTGYLAEVNWKLPFIVYLFPIISIILTGYLKTDLKKIESDKSSQNKQVEIETQKKIKGGIKKDSLIRYMLYYGMATFLTVVVSFYLPFLMEQYKYTSGTAGDLISLFFLAIMLPGFFLKSILKVLKQYVYGACVLIIAAGMAIVLMSHSVIVIGIGCILNGLGYGVIQPYIYDKTSAIATQKKVTLALAFVMAMNYVAILSCPFIINAAKDIFKVQSQTFAFWFALIVALATWLIVFGYNKMKKVHE